MASQYPGSSAVSLSGVDLPGYELLVTIVRCRADGLSANYDELIQLVRDGGCMTCSDSNTDPFTISYFVPFDVADPLEGRLDEHTARDVLVVNTRSGNATQLTTSFTERLQLARAITASPSMPLPDIGDNRLHVIVECSHPSNSVDKRDELVVLVRDNGGRIILVSTYKAFFAYTVPWGVKDPLEGLIDDFIKRTIRVVSVQDPRTAGQISASQEGTGEA